MSHRPQSNVISGLPWMRCAWHRVAALLCCYLRRVLKVPVLRYVDDLWSSSRASVYWSGGRCLDVVTLLLGLPLDVEKSANDLLNMVVLGVHVALDV